MTGCRRPVPACMRPATCVRGGSSRTRQTFSHGPLAEEARQQGIDVQTFTEPFSGIDRAILDGEREGFVRVHVRRGSDRILGATVVGENAGDLIGEISVAMQAGAGLGKIAKAIHPYPTRADAIRRLGDQYNRTRLTPLVASLMRRFLSWQR